MNKKDEQTRAIQILAKLKRLFPNARVFLHYKTEFELLVAVILSAQCTDERVNAITPKLFARFQSVADFASADRKELETLIFSSGFYRAKADHIIGAAAYLQNVHQGKIPHTMKEMICIPGVGRKTASVVLGTLFNISEGIAVDTHVRRLANVFGFIKSQNVLLIEKKLMELYPKNEWNTLTYFFIEYGRAYCPAKKHDQAKCPIPHAR